jgi:cbb3-type cytochrome oxidase cytochrome c subunit
LKDVKREAVAKAVDKFFPDITNGYSKTQIFRRLRKLDLPYRDDEIEKIKNDLKEKAEHLKTDN